jgi:hypothetical protein
MRFLPVTKTECSRTLSEMFRPSPIYGVVSAAGIDDNR